MYKNFASQPPAYLYGGSLTADDLKGQVAPNGDFFYKRSHFVECEKPTTMNADGGFDWGGLLTKGIDVYGGIQKQKLTETAIQLQEQQNRQEALRLKQQELELKKEQEKTSIIKSYGVPIAIAGGVIILGIAAYFIFKKRA